jgi:hypothetical protein
MAIALSDAGRALAFLSVGLGDAEKVVQTELRAVFDAQERLRQAIDARDAIQKTLNLTARYVAAETK